MKRMKLAKLKHKPVPAIVRVHLHMASALPAADDNGLLDPYFKLSFKEGRGAGNGSTTPGSKLFETRRRKSFQRFEEACDSSNRLSSS